MIEALLAGKSAAAVFPTGAGKSLCYQLPAVLFSGMTLVVSPLMALMKDQVDALKARGVAAEKLDSSLSAEEYAEVLQKARRGELKLLYVAPERFNNERFRSSFSGFEVSLMAIDEAHCVSEWGHNFRPDYLKLSRYAESCGAQRILALTATATPRVLEDIKKRFQLNVAVRTAFHRPNLHLGAELAPTEEAKFQGLVRKLGGSGGPAIVYVTYQKTAEMVAERLASEGFEVMPYHAGMDSELRAQTQEQFLLSESAVVVATIAFGMGIDKPNIRAVYHYDPPKSLENYSQEIGRAGRDGKPSVCHFFYYPPDRIPLENFVYGDTPSRNSLDTLLADLFSQDDELVLNLYGLSRDHDIRTLVLRTLLTYLELDGYLEALTPVYSTYKFKPAAPSREILAAYQGEEQRFLADILKNSVKKRVWFELDIEDTAKKLGVSRVDVVRAIDRCGNDGWLELKVSDLRFRYQVLKRPENIEQLAEELHQKSLEREEQEVNRLQQALSLVTEPGCLATRLAHHFGEKLEASCGVCTDCRGLTEQVDPDLDSEPFEIGQLPDELGGPRDTTRFLCGVSSPSLRRRKLHRHPGFGRLERVSFKRVLERVSQLSTR